MIYVIQTNTSIDAYGTERDFQSMVFPYESWDKYKEDLLDENARHEIIQGTMMGSIKSRCCKIKYMNINDDFHIEVIVDGGYRITNIKAYKVDKDRMDFVCKK